MSQPDTYKAKLIGGPRDGEIVKTSYIEYEVAVFGTPRAMSSDDIPIYGKARRYVYRWMKGTDNGEYCLFMIDRIEDR